MRVPWLRGRLFLSLAAVLSVWGLPAVAAQAGTSPSGFVTAPLPPAPSSGLTGTNEDAEPGMGVDGAGTYWVASDIEPYAAHDTRVAGGVFSGADVWKSTDGGQSYTFVAAPFNAVQGQGSAGGEDTDLAVAPVANSSGCYNVYVASLYVGSTNIAISQDCGKTWTLVPVNGEPGQDRPWLSADGQCTFYLSYHGLAPYDTIVDKFSLCNPTAQAIGSAENPLQTAEFAGNIAPGLTNRFGKQVVDNSPSSPHQHRLYVPMEGCPTPTVQGLPEASVGCSTTAEIVVATSDDGITFTDHVVSDTASQQLYIWPDTVATDAAGNVYAGWFSGGVAYVSRSSDGGSTWGPKVQVNSAPVQSVAYTTVAAGADGVLDVAFYGTNRPGDSADATVMGQPNVSSTNPTSWALYLATSTDHGASFTQRQVSNTVHTGVICTSGGGCGVYPGDRNLLDDFGLAISPTTGLASMVFDNDQPGGVQGQTHTDFATESGPSSILAEAPSPALAVVAGLLALTAAAAAGRRRRASSRAALSG
ncbi:MAG: hypothetical protein ACYDAC_05495 [Candidatus Dormibacteria bacterium]